MEACRAGWRSRGTNQLREAESALELKGGGSTAPAEARCSDVDRRTDAVKAQAARTAASTFTVNCRGHVINVLLHGRRAWHITVVAAVGLGPSGLLEKVRRRRRWARRRLGRWRTDRLHVRARLRAGNDERVHLGLRLEPKVELLALVATPIPAVILVGAWRVVIRVRACEEVVVCAHEKCAACLNFWAYNLF
eukprot:6200656-Pleurochrysis_carterae.AAC.1